MIDGIKQRVAFTFLLCVKNDILIRRCAKFKIVTSTRSLPLVGKKERNLCCDSVQQTLCNNVIRLGVFSLSYYECNYEM